MVNVCLFIWCVFIFEKNAFHLGNMLSSNLWLMGHSYHSNGLVKMHTKLSFLIIMRFLLFPIIMVK